MVTHVFVGVGMCWVNINICQRYFVILVSLTAWWARNWNTSDPSDAKASRAPLWPCRGRCGWGCRDLQGIRIRDVQNVATRCQKLFFQCQLLIEVPNHSLTSFVLNFLPRLTLQLSVQLDPSWSRKVARFDDWLWPWQTFKAKSCHRAAWHYAPWTQGSMAYLEVTGLICESPNLRRCFLDDWWLVDQILQQISRLEFDSEGNLGALPPLIEPAARKEQRQSGDGFHPESEKQRCFSANVPGACAKAPRQKWRWRSPRQGQSRPLTSSWSHSRIPRLRHHQFQHWWHTAPVRRIQHLVTKNQKVTKQSPKWSSAISCWGEIGGVILGLISTLQVKNVRWLQLADR